MEFKFKIDTCFIPVRGHINFKSLILHIDDNFQFFSQSSFPSVNKKEIDKLGELKRCNLRAINIGLIQSPNTRFLPDQHGRISIISNVK